MRYFAGGVFFVAKEYPSRTLPKKSTRDFYIFLLSEHFPVFVL